MLKDRARGRKTPFEWLSGKTRVDDGERWINIVKGGGRLNLSAYGRTFATVTWDSKVTLRHDGSKEQTYWVQGLLSALGMGYRWRGDAHLMCSRVLSQRPRLAAVESGGLGWAVVPGMVLRYDDLADDLYVANHPWGDSEEVYALPIKVWRRWREAGRQFIEEIVRLAPFVTPDGLVSEIYEPEVDVADYLLKRAMYDDVSGGREVLVRFLREQIRSRDWQDVCKEATKQELALRGWLWGVLKTNGAMGRHRVPRVLVERIINDGMIFVYDGDTVQEVPLLGDWHG